MSNEVKQIGQRLKALREISGLSVSDAAKEFKVPENEYKDYEEGKKDIPIGLLFKAASFFNVELTAILTGDEPKLRLYSLVKNGKGLAVKRREPYIYQSLAYNFMDKKAEVFMVTVEPNSNNTPVQLNSHPGQEFNYVIEGTLMIKLNDKEIILNEGDSLYFDSSVPHGMKALNNKKSRFLAIIL